MPIQEPGAAEPRRPAFCSEVLARERRKKRVLSLVAAGLPMPQGRVFELLRTLREPVLDLAWLTKIIRAEPLIQAHLLSILHCSWFEPCERPLELSEAVVLLGSERLRILALGCALAEFAGRRLPPATMRSFWRHSILTAMLSERIAREAHPELAEQAYLAGLLHDIGRLPLLIAAGEQQQRGEPIPQALDDEPAREHSYFGAHHGEVGRWVALSANCAPWMVDVLAHHHNPTHASEDPALVAIVAAADRSSQPSFEDQALGPEAEARSLPPCAELLGLARPSGLLEEHRAALSRFLEDSRWGAAPYPRFGLS